MSIFIKQYQHNAELPSLVQRETLEDLRPADHRVEVVDLEHCQPFLPVMREYRLLMRSTGVPSESGTAFATE